MTEIIIAVMAGIGVNILYSEYQRWSPWLCEKLLKFATFLQSGNPCAQHDFYPEWQAIVANSQGSNLTKLILASGAVITAIKLNLPNPLELIRTSLPSNNIHKKNNSSLWFTKLNSRRLARAMADILIMSSLFYGGSVGINSEMNSNPDQAPTVPTTQSPIKNKDRNILPSQESGELLVAEKSIEIDPISKTNFLNRNTITEIDSFNIQIEELALTNDSSQNNMSLIQIIPLLLITLLAIIGIYYINKIKLIISRYSKIALVNKEVFSTICPIYLSTQPALD